MSTDECFPSTISRGVGGMQVLHALEIPRRHETVCSLEARRTDGSRVLGFPGRPVQRIGELNAVRISALPAILMDEVRRPKTDGMHFALQIDDGGAPLQS